MNLSTGSLVKRKEILILFLCLIIGFALRFYNFDKKSLWIDEIHTLNDSRDDFEGQLRFYKENPTYLHPPLFFILSHLFYPFAKPEMDLRIIPLIFGTLSIPMMYFLAKSFSPTIALPCTLSLTFMAYHISLSQDGRSYTLLMFLGMAGLYFYMQYLKTFRRGYLFFVVVHYVLLFYISYSSLPLIVLSQFLWFYGICENGKRPDISSFFILNVPILLFCLPWLLFIALHYSGQPLLDPFSSQGTGSLASILFGIFNDWVPHKPLMVISISLLIIFPISSRHKNNTFILLLLFFSPVAGLYFFSKLFHIEHFFNSRYFINFLPLFFISIYLSLNTIELRFERLRRFLRLKPLFVILLIASNIIILPLYYRSEKQDFRGLISYLGGQLQDGDKIFVRSIAYIPGILYYFGINPESRHYNIPLTRNNLTKAIEAKISIISHNGNFTIFHSDICCDQYVADGSRLWVIVGKPAAREIKKKSPFVLKGYFDGSFASFRRFPSDASMYLFIWDPKSPNEKGIEMQIE